jgi:hypothetical protein
MAINSKQLYRVTFSVAKRVFSTGKCMAEMSTGFLALSAAKSRNHGRLKEKTRKM